MPAPVFPLQDLDRALVVPGDHRQATLAQRLAYRIATPPYNGEPVVVDSKGPPPAQGTMDDLMSDARFFTTLDPPSGNQGKLLVEQIEYGAIMGNSIAKAAKVVLENSARPIERVNAVRMMAIAARMPCGDLANYFIDIIGNAKISDAEKVDDREALAAELIDRFGPLPQEADQLLKVVAIKGLCRQANVAKIDVGPKGAVVTFRNDQFAKPENLIPFLARNQVAWKVRPDNKVVVKGEWETPQQRLGAAEKVLSELAKLAAA